MTPLLMRMLAPALKLMSRLRLATKVSLLCALLALPLLSLVVFRANSLHGEWQTARSEHAGTRWVSSLLNLAHDVQDHRDLTHRVLSGDDSAGSQQDAARKRLAEAVKSMDAVVGSEVAFAAPKGWEGLRPAIAAIAEGRHSDRAEAANDEHQQVLRQIDHWLYQIADASLLLLDPKPGTFHLMDLAVSTLLPYADALAAARGQVLAIAATGISGARAKAQLQAAAQHLIEQTDRAAMKIEALTHSGMAAPSHWAASRSSSEDFVKTLRSLAREDAPAADASALGRQAAQVLDNADKLTAETIALLSTRLQQRQATTWLRLLLEVGLTAAGVAVVGYLGLALFFSFYGGLQRLHRGVETAARGDLSQSIAIDGHDEVAEIGDGVNRMNEHLSAMVSDIRSSAVRVGLAGRSVADGSAQLALRTEEQAASLRHTLAAARSLAQAVSHNAQAAASLDQLTSRLRDDAETGGQAMRDTVQTMSQLESSSKRVGEIIAVIDGIAFQTNILALNAAVEAARAGEQGRGFAVVAAEVRQLAQRSSAAAGEIRTLIHQSGEQVEASVSRITHVGQVLDSLVGGVRSASDSLRAIAAASAQQSSELEQVAQRVGNLDGITQQNATLVSQSAESARELVARAGALSKAVSSMRLRQGSADEAKTLVDRALPLLQQRGLPGASAELHSRETGFVDRDLYIFVIDRTGTYRLHGAKPAMEGKRVHDVPGINGDKFVRDAWAAVATGGGWIDYDIVTPDTGAVTPKTSYVVGLSNDLFVGCGVYRRTDALAAEPAARTPTASSSAASVARPRTAVVATPVTART